MATESPVRLLGNSGGGNWPSSQETTSFTSSSNSMGAKELGLLMKDHRFHGDRKEAVPNRSGSAPPSVEGSFAAIRNFIGQQNASLDHNLPNTSNVVVSCESEEQLRADPAYLSYYLSNVNLNPRLPPPLISRENRHLAHHIGRLGDNRQMVSFDDNGNTTLFPYRASLATHKEEPEDDRSPTQTNATVDTFLSKQSVSSAEVRHKSVVDLIQEDFPRTPSPVFSQSHSSNHGLTEAMESDARQYLSVIPLLSSSSSDRTGSPYLGPKGESTSGDIQLGNDDLVSDGVGSNRTINASESEMKTTSISSENRSQHARQHPQQNSSHTKGSTYQVHGAQSQLASQGMRRSHNGMDNFSRGPAKLPPVEVPVLQTAGITPPPYATATAYMTSGNPFFPNLQQSNLFAPQFNVGGYGLNTSVMPPFLTGYPPHGTIPMALESPANPSINNRTNGVGITTGIDLQQFYKLYGQLGVAVQPSFSDPLYINYFQHPSVDPYGGIGQYDTMTPRGTAMGNQVDNYDPQVGPSAVYSPDQRSSHLRGGGVSIPGHRKGNIASPSYYGSPPNMGLLMQYPTSPLGSPVLPGSPVAGTNLPGRRNENVRLPVSASRNMGAYSGWQGQRGREKLDDPKPYSFLEELKSSKARKFELADIAGRVVEFSADQHGSRFIQQKLENCSDEEKAAVFEEVLPHASTLITDVFGNYVIQKFFEHGSAKQKKELADELTGHILPLSLQMYGCRVIQKALEVIELEQKTQLVQELDGHVMRCVRDQNGNHVIQKCIERVPTEKIGFIISAFHGQVATLSTHPYGCRVIQRVLEHCTDKSQSQCIVDEILQSACILAQDQYGNYVTQHVLEKGKPDERSQIISKLAGQIVQMSQHKFASNVIEKCLEHGDTVERELLIEEIVGQTEGNDNLLIMMKDQFANYVVQKILDTCTDKQREILLNRIRIHLPALKKYTYGKHIVARVERFSGEETHASES